MSGVYRWSKGVVLKLLIGVLHYVWRLPFRQILCFDGCGALFLPFVFYGKAFLSDFDEQQSDARPHQFSYPDDERDEDSGTGGDAELRGGHEESALTATQLQWHEEQEVGEKGGKGDDENALQVVH